MTRGWLDVERVFDVLLDHDPALDAALAASDRAGLPAIAVAPNQGQMLRLLAASVGARRIVEVGTLGGYSTIWLARALPHDGRLVTLEIDAHHATVARDNLAHAGLADRVEVRIGPALDALDALRDEGFGPVDFAFVDADKANNAAYVERLVAMARPGALLVVDNVVREGRVTDAASTDPSVRGVLRLVDALRDEARVETTVVQTVGSKGWDGWLLARVR